MQTEILWQFSLLFGEVLKQFKDCRRTASIGRLYTASAPRRTAKRSLHWPNVDWIFLCLITYDWTEFHKIIVYWIVPKLNFCLSSSFYGRPTLQRSLIVSLCKAHPHIHTHVENCEFTNLPALRVEITFHKFSESGELRHSLHSCLIYSAVKSWLVFLPLGFLCEFIFTKKSSLCYCHFPFFFVLFWKVWGCFDIS